MARDVSDDNPLTPEEALDSDEVRNDDGDEVVDPPDQWIAAGDRKSLDERLADEVPDVSPGSVDTGQAADTVAQTEPSPASGRYPQPHDELDRIDPQGHGRSRAQIDGAPEDGESFFDVEQ